MALVLISTISLQTQADVWEYWIENYGTVPVPHATCSPQTVGACNPPNSSSNPTPYNGSGDGLQTLLNWLFSAIPGSPGGYGNTVKLIFGPGTFEMYPIILHNTTWNDSFNVVGAGRGITILKLKDNASDVDPDVNPEEDVMFETPSRPMRAFGIQDVTLDCNWLGQYGSSPSFADGYKATGIRVTAEYIDIQNVHVTNWGSNRPGYLDPNAYAGAEAFAISASTANVGQTGVPIRINGCLVDNFSTAGSFSYCTAIMVSTSNSITTNIPSYAPALASCGETARLYIDPNQNASDRGQWPYNLGCRTSLLALVDNNEVDGGHFVNGNQDITEAIGYGAARSQLVAFVSNTAVNCKVGFNSDTFPIDNLTISDNTFEDVQLGIEVGNPNGNFSNLNIFYNDIRLNGEAFFHSTDGIGISGTVINHFWGVAAGIRLKGSTQVNLIAYNEVYAVPESAWVFVDPLNFRTPPSQSEAYYIPLLVHESTSASDSNEKMFGHLGGDHHVTNLNLGLSPTTVYGNTTSTSPGRQYPAIPFPSLGGNWDADGELPGATTWDALSGTENYDVP